MRHAPQGLLGTIRGSLHAKFVVILSAIALLVGALSAVDLAATERSLTMAQKFIRLQENDQNIYDGLIAYIELSMIDERDILLNLNKPKLREDSLAAWRDHIDKVRTLSSEMVVSNAAFDPAPAGVPEFAERQDIFLRQYISVVEDIAEAARLQQADRLQKGQAELEQLRPHLDNSLKRIHYLRELQDESIRHTAEAMEIQAARSRMLVIFISFVFLLAIFGAVLLFPNCVTRPLSRLCEATDWLAAGDLTTRVKVDRHDEIGRLAVNFNGMANTIEHRTMELEQKNQRLLLAQKRLRKHARHIERMRKDALQANSAKSDFLARMSHEIRTPLAATLGFADLLLDQCDSPDQMRECVRVIQQNGQHLLAIINDILDLSKIEAGKLSAQFAPCQVISLLAEVSSLMRYKAEEKGLQFRLSFDTEIPERIQTDATRLRQILLNLLNNAIKFTPKGKIELHVHMNQHEDQHTYLYCDVRDDGIGMSQRQLQQLFQPFVQVHQNSAQYGGTGLGLTISRTLAQMLGGDLTATSAPNQGSVFHLRISTGDLTDVPLVLPKVQPDVPTNIPIPPVTPDAPREIVPAPQHKEYITRVLVAEDTPALRRYMEIILQRTGYMCDLVETGPEVLERMRAARRDEKPYTVLLLDLLLPGMDGFDVLRNLQADHDPTPVVALTAHAMRHVQEKCMAAGFAEFLSKPVDRGILLDLIRRLAEQGANASRGDS